MDLRQGIVVSNTNLVDAKKEVPFPWKGALAIAIATLVCWGGAYALDSVNKSQANEIQKNLNSMKSGRDYKKIAYVVDLESRLQSAKEVIKERTNWDNFFQKLEQNTVQEIVFENLEAKKEDNSNQIGFSGKGQSESSFYKITLKGKTVGLNNLARQVAAFREGGDKAFASDVKIQNISLKKTDMTSDGGAIDGATPQDSGSGTIDFTMDLTINPLVLKTDFSQAGTSQPSQNQ